MGRNSFVVLLAIFFVQSLPAATVGVYFNQADWEAAMSLNGTNPLTKISFADAQWTSNFQVLSHGISQVSQSTTAASNGMSVSINSECDAPGVCAMNLGQISNSAWTDNLEKYSSTNFIFGSAVYGFGGNFDIAQGNGLEIRPGGMLPYPEYTGGNLFFSYPSYDGFIGVITDQPISDIFLSWGDNGSCYECFSNSYTLSNFEVATLPTPEPNFRYAIAGLALLGFCYAINKRS